MNDELEKWEDMIMASCKTLQHVVCFLPSNSPASEFYMLFRNTQSVRFS